MSSNIKSDIRWGVKVGLFFACFFSLAAIAISLISGETELGGISIAAALIVYFSGGVVSGLLLGVLRPLTRSRTGSVLVGPLVVAPAALAGCVAAFGPMGQWTENEAISFVIGAVLLGVGGGYLYWEPDET